MIPVSLAQQLAASLYPLILKERRKPRLEG
jgi:hypothetical protein